MKILHTSDWHLGHRLLEQSQQEEQILFLEWITNVITEREIDILLISGDIFDVSVPSAHSQRMYYDFLINLRNTPCKHIVITAGNHDAPSNIDAPKALLSALSIDVVGRASENMAEEVFAYSVGDDSVIIAAIPYLRDQDIRRAVVGETFEQIDQRYRQALMRHYASASKYCKSINKNGLAQIAMGHLFAIGGQPSDSEQSIYVGSLGDIAAKDFPKDFDYIALGHLHRPQIVDKNPNIRYSGSPNILSFSEVNYSKKVIELEVKENKISDIIELDVPRFRCICQIKGGLQHCLDELEIMAAKQYSLTPWVEVVIDNRANNIIGYNEIQRRVQEIKSRGIKLEVLKVGFKNTRNTKGIEELISLTKNIKELNPQDVFKEKCKEQDFNLDDNVDIFDAFNEIVNLVKEGKR